MASAVKIAADIVDTNIVLRTEWSRAKFISDIATALLAEREACAVAAEQYLENGDGSHTSEDQRWTAETIAMDIRCRTDGYRERARETLLQNGN